MKSRVSIQTSHLEQRLLEAEATIAALLSDQIDAVIDPDTKSPILLSRAQQALRESEARAQHYLDTATVMLIALDVDGRIELINRYACDTLGWAPAELVRRDWITTCVPERQRETSRNNLRDAAAGDLAITENLVCTKAGDERLIEWRSSARRDQSGIVEGTLISGVDITERRTLEARYQQAQKMEAVGQLASGVAHDFNNLLTVIIGFTEIVTSDEGLNGAHASELAEILSAAQSASGLTKQLLAFSRQQVLRAAPVDVNALIVHMNGLLGRLIGEHVEIATSLAPGLALAFADRGQLEQVVMNLVVNARDAMPDGGRVTIATSNVELDDASFQNEAALQGLYVMLAITDTGTGMAAETHRRLFEPFFTTKESGKGTGLGLSTTYGIVKQSKGYIGVDSTLGSGTTFKVYLPRAVSGVTALVAPIARDVLARRPSETVMLVEDEPGVRRLSKRILERAGYHVIEAVDGTEAERLFAMHSGKISLLVTDIVMPRCGGPALYGRLKAHSPKLRVLYMSGYTNQSTAQQAEIDAGLPFVQKPFTAAEFERRVREALC
jgi:two-component system, cell cycle sensor histidine kinase and response regulator CckA